MADKLKKYLYRKTYKKDENGRLVLINPELLIKYISEKSKELFESYRTKKQEEIKLEILNDFFRILKNDKKYEILPESIGTFNTKKDEEHYINTTILSRTMSSYLGNIFTNYHAMLLKSNQMITEELNLSGIVIDYNDLYFRAMSDYFQILLTGEKDIGYKYKNLIPKEFTDITTEKTFKIETNEIPKEIKRPISQNSYTSTLSFPILIEKILTEKIYKKKLEEAFKKIDDLLFYKAIELTKDEQILYNIINKPGDKILSGKSKDQLKKELYEMFLKYKAVNEEDDKLILTGMSDKYGKLTLNSLIKTKYSKNILKSEYYKLLIKIFDTTNLNYRNNVTHGNEPIYNCYDITFSAILLQIIWDIINNEAFIEKIWLKYRIEIKVINNS